MSAILYNLDAMNLFAGDDDPNNSLFMVINSVKIPGLNEKTKGHSGGGLSFDMEIGMGSYDSLAMSFTCEGPNPEIIAGLGIRKKYTARGNMKNVETGADVAMKVIVDGKLTKYEPSSFERDKGITSDYELKEVLAYQLWIDGQETIYVDVLAGPLGIRINGVQAQLQRARNLGLA